MKRTSNVLGALGLLLLATACSGAGDEPAPFASATDLGSRLAADLGCGFRRMVIARIAAS